MQHSDKKFSVRRVKQGGITNLALFCDGEIVPCQSSTVMLSEVDSLAKFIVVFEVFDNGGVIDEMDLPAEQV